MKVTYLIFSILFLTNLYAQDPQGMIKVSEEKSYNPKFRGLTDLVVELSSPQITKQLNEQMIFGTLNEVSFKIYWTANPERVAVDVLGLPEGFREIKEELKAMIVGKLETIIPIPFAQKFKGYQLKKSTKQERTIVATDSTNMMPVPEYELIMDEEGKLVESIAKKPIGIIRTKMKWEKATWSEPKYFLTSSTSVAEEGPQTLEIESDTSWQVINSIGVPTVTKTKTKQTLNQPGTKNKPMERNVEETLYFKNYKINIGEAMKWFLSHSSPNQ
ncbi:MAG: hypothetical protein K2P81_04820 [Bacteriovoracaceae bacterium]|nr:hypothetical protein [Bacteriovoracaceae bacterium]